jgi:subtilisin family serine protease
LIFFFSDVPEGLEGVPCEGDLTSCDQSYIWSDSSRERDDLVPGFDQELDIVAPGTRVFAPWLEAGAAANPFLNAPGCDPFIGRCPVNYLLLDGTSIAAPHVAGVAALLLQAKPDLTQEEMECILKHTAIKIPAGSYTDPFNQDFHAWTTADREQGKGLIQADKALDCIGPGGDLSSCGCATP